MILNLDPINILILIVAVINATFGVIIYSKDKKSSTSIWFFLLAVSVSFWGVSMFLFRSIHEIYFGEIFARILYFSAAAIPMVFIYFSLIFPNKTYSFSFLQKNILSLPFFAIALVSLIPGYLINGVQFISGGETHIVFNNFYHTLYVLYINIFFAYGYFLLVQKYIASRTNNTLLNKQIIYIIAGTFISTMIGVFTNLLGPYFGIFKFNWAGQIGNVVMVSVIGYAILKYQLFSIKLILVELGILLLNLFLLLNIFTSHSSISLTLDISILVLVILFSVILMRGIYKDISDREKIEALARDMEVANERLRMMEGQKTEFVSIASHQLRTPLTVIKGYASMILEGTFGNINAGARDAMEKLYKSSDRIVALVEDLLTVSRIEQGRMMLSFEVIDFKEFVDSVLADMKKEIGDSKLELSFNTEGRRGFKVSIDAKKFKQAVRHILDNAIKYTHTPGKIHLTLTEDVIANKIRLSISDTGDGMTPEQIETIFERFNLKIGTNLDQVEREEKNEQKRALEDDENEEKTSPGIGLYIAQEIIEAHHGILRIESVGPGKGVTVVVELPMAGATSDSVH